MKWRHLLLLLLCQCQLSCLTSREDLKPSVLPEADLRLVSHIEKGKGYVAQARYDLGEVEFRHALGIAPKNALLYNDLGFLLLQENRSREAVLLLEQGLELAPRDMVLQENLARALYKMGEIEEVNALLDRLLEAHRDQKLTEIGNPARTHLQAHELTKLYRNLAIARYRLGINDDAVCFSLLAMLHSPTSEEKGQHGRTLLATERSLDAAALLKAVVLEQRSEVNPSIMFDYSLALAASGDGSAAEQALNRLLGLSSVSTRERLDSKLVLAVLAQGSSREERALELIKEVADEDPAICETKPNGGASYWPSLVVHGKKSLLTKYCGEHELESVI